MEEFCQSLAGAEELDCTQSEKFLTFSFSPQAIPMVVAAEQLLEAEPGAGAAPGLFAALCLGREALEPLSCPSSSQELRGLLQGSACLGSAMGRTGVSICFSCQHKVQQCKGHQQLRYLWC